MVFLALSAASALLLAVLAVVLWVRRPPAPLWPIVFVCQALALVWVLGDLWASNARSLQEKQLAFLVLFSGSVPIAACWWETIRRYVQVHGLGQPWIDSPWTRLPLWFAAAAWLLAITNPWHGQFITPVVDGENVYRWGIRSVLVANYAMGAGAIVLCGWAARQHPSAEVRRKLLLLIGATLAPAATNILHLNLPLWPREDTTSIGLGVGSLIVLYGILRVRLFIPMPATLDQVLSRVPEGLLMLDRGGRLVAWNPAAERLLRGIELQPDMRLLRQLARGLTDEQGRRRLRSSRQLADLLASGAEVGASHVFRYSGSGEERWLDLSLIPVPGRRGALAAVCLSVTDVTEPRRAAREREHLAKYLRDLDKLRSLSRMAGGIAHDFNNLLTTIAGNTRLALDETAPEGELREYLEEVHDSARHAAELTDQLLTYAGRSELLVEPVSIAQLVREAGTLLNSAEAGPMELRLQLAEDSAAVEGDAGQLRQVVLNLLANAREAIGADDGFITIRTGPVELNQRVLEPHGLEDELQPGPYVLLEVHDSGCGMDEGTRRRAFEPFFTTKPAGRGLGLAAVFGIVRAHRGAIRVESETGRGSTFRIWLPVAPEADPGKPTPQRPRSAPAPTGNEAILVVDDQEGVRRLANRVLDRAGYRVQSASSAHEAMRLFRREPGAFDLVLLDLTMPESDAEEVLRRMQQIDPDVPVLVTSGFDETNAMKRLAGAKLGGFLHKPWEPSELLAAVRHALAKATPRPD